VWAKQVQTLIPRPVLRVRRNAEVGLGADLSASAPESADWVKIGPVTWNATATGGVYVELVTFATGHLAACWWDDLAIT
jgi:hypothetical protein